MKKISIFLIALSFVSCLEKKDLSHIETAEIVAERFYQGDNSTLEKYTTPESYAVLTGLQAMFTEDKSSEANFKILEETIDGDVAWVKYSTSYDPTPGVFKMVKVDGQWKVTERMPREKLPF